MEDTRYIAALDLGTSKIALCVAAIDGETAEMVYYRETPSAGISRSSVLNPRQAGSILKELIQDAENQLSIKITQVVTGLPKYYIRQESCQEKQERNEDHEINEEEISSLMEIAKSNVNLENEESETIYGAVAQSYSDGEDFQIKEEDIIGRFSRVIEGNFKIFIGKKSYIGNIERVCKSANVSLIRRYFTADTTAKAVLDKSEMENGVALIDFGAGAVSVSIYLGGIMRHYAAIPFGGKSITCDINNECAISEALAENIKKAYGYCTPDDLQNMAEKELQIKSGCSDPDKRISIKYLSEIIHARVDEIIDAVLFEIQKSGCNENLRSGLVITGGGIELGGSGKLFHTKSGYCVRVGYPKPKFKTQCSGIRDASASVCAGLILAAKSEHRLNCATIGEIEKAKVNIETTMKAPAAKEEPTADKNGGELFGGEEIKQEIKKPAPKPLPKPKTKPKAKPDDGPGLWSKLKIFAEDIMNPDDSSENNA